MRRSAAWAKMKYNGKAAETRESMGAILKVVIPKGKISEDRIFFAVALDIGASCILIESDKIMARGERVKCTFVLRRKIDIAGEVIIMVCKQLLAYFTMRCS